jgi:hypothetical protein
MRDGKLRLADAGQSIANACAPRLAFRLERSCAAAPDPCWRPSSPFEHPILLAL